MDKDVKYNGWTNKATWLVRLWIDNNPEYYSDTRDMLKSYEGLEADKKLQSEIEEEVYNDVATSEASMCLDLVTHALSQVNWTEIVNSIKEE